MDRRDFIKASALTAGGLWLSGFEAAFAKGKSSPAAGKKLKPWKKGQFQIHFIYTGVAESIFMIFPDGTTMLLDCGDHNAIGRGKLAVPVLPNSKRHAGEWIARYVQRVNPGGDYVDYMMLSHYHADHAGCLSFYSRKVERDGEEFVLSGFSEAAETLRFGKAFDRSWPTFDDPIPVKDNEVTLHIRKFYEYQAARNGLAVEKFVPGRTDQVVLLKAPSAYDFSVRNLCGNGKIAAEDGTVTDLYAERIAREHPSTLNENGMSTGMIIRYGKFLFYTAGDFSDSWKLPDGSKFRIEEAIADVCPRVDVAKINHHGHYSMPEKLVKALRARVYVSCVWDQLHDVAPVMARLADRSLYPGDRIICPGIFPVERREEDAGKAWLDDVAPASFEGGHVVVTVAKGGDEYSVAYLTADDESMTVRSSLDFRSGE